MNKNVLFAAVVASMAVVSAPSYAAYISTADLSGKMIVKGYGDGTPGTYQITLQDVTGSVTTQVPPPGNYNVALDGLGFIDISPNPLVPDIAITPSFLGIFSGLIDVFGVSFPNATFNFAAGASGVNDTALGLIDFGVDYDGETSDAVINFLNSLLALIPGSTPLSNPNGSGHLDILGTLFSDGAVLNVTEVATDWPGFGVGLAMVDNIPNPLNPNELLFGERNVVDATFRVDMTATATAVPEPTTLALLGLGLMGLGLSRRRAV